MKRVQRRISREAQAMNVEREHQQNLRIGAGSTNDGRKVVLLNMPEAWASDFAEGLRAVGTLLAQIAQEVAPRKQEKEDMSTPDIIVKNAAGVASPTMYAFFDEAHAAVEAGGTIQLAARTYTTTTPNQTFQITKRCKVLGSVSTAPRTVIAGVPIGSGGVRRSTLKWRSNDGPMLRIRNGNNGIGQVDVLDSGVVLDGIIIEPDRNPVPGSGDVWQRQDAPIDCLRVQAGDVGTQPRVDIRNCVFRNGAGGIAQEILNAGQPNESLRVNATNVVIEDMYGVRNADGTPATQNGSQWHAQGWYSPGGLSRRENVTTRRIGTIAGSPVYRDSNKEQGDYNIGADVEYFNCTWEDIGHCGMQVRGGTVTFENLTFRRCPMGMQVSHKQESTNLNVTGVGTCQGSGVNILQPRVFISPTDGPIISAGLVIDACENANIDSVLIDGAGGTFGGGWGGLHFARVAEAFLNLSNITVRNWAVGIRFDEPLEGGTFGSAAETNFDAINVQNCPVPWGVNWPNTDDPQGPAAIGGTWNDCNIGGGFDQFAVIG